MQITVETKVGTERLLDKEELYLCWDKWGYSSLYCGGCINNGEQREKQAETTPWESIDSRSPGCSCCGYGR